MCVCVGGGLGRLRHKYARDGTACDTNLITLKCNLRHMFVSHEPKIISYLICLRVYAYLRTKPAHMYSPILTLDGSKVRRVYGGK